MTIADINLSSNVRIHGPYLLKFVISPAGEYCLLLKRENGNFVSVPELESWMNTTNDVVDRRGNTEIETTIVPCHLFVAYNEIFHC